MSSTDDVRTLIGRINQELYGAGRVEVAEELIHDDFVNHTAPDGMPTGRDGVTAFVSMLHTGLSNPISTIEQLVTDGDSVGWRWRLRGTHTGELMGVAATGRPLDVSGNDLGRVQDGKLVELWTEVDTLAILEQLGALNAAH